MVYVSTLPPSKKKNFEITCSSFSLYCNITQNISKPNIIDIREFGCDDDGKIT